jgi:hypothetical protein
MEEKIKRTRHTEHEENGDETEANKDRNRTKKNKKSVSVLSLPVSFCFVTGSSRLYWVVIQLVHHYNPLGHMCKL